MENEATEPQAEGATQPVPMSAPAVEEPVVAAPEAAAPVMETPAAPAPAMDDAPKKSNTMLWVGLVVVVILAILFFTGVI